ncbi:MAG TPA: hypothetical protein VGE26_00875, partial [Sphingobacteriaceae bacterium]
MNLKKIFLAATFLFATTTSGAQVSIPDAAALKLKLQKLNTLGSVLYIAAHPDDENTRLLAYLAKER